jgi:hypothetical protein
MKLYIDKIDDAKVYVAVLEFEFAEVCYMYLH